MRGESAVCRQSFAPALCDGEDGVPDRDPWAGDDDVGGGDQLVQARARGPGDELHAHGLQLGSPLAHGVGGVVVDHHHFGSALAELAGHGEPAHSETDDEGSLSHR